MEKMEDNLSSSDGSELDVFDEPERPDLGLEYKETGLFASRSKTERNYSDIIFE